METIDNLKTVLDAGTALAATVKPSLPSEIVLVPEGYQLASTEKIIREHLPNPRRLEQEVSLATAESFIRYLNEFKTPATKVFAAWSAAAPNTCPVLTAILDYHAPDQPRWCEHAATYACAWTPEWNRWTSWDRKHMDQETFAGWLEDNQDLIVEPKGAELLELVQNLEGKRDITCKSFMRLKDGGQRLVYDEAVELKGTVSAREGHMDFPDALVAGIVPFDGGLSYVVRARLKHRIPNRRLEFWFESIDLHVVVKDAVKGIIAQVKEKTGIEPLLGEAH